jgi:hypothetical protein
MSTPILRRAALTLAICASVGLSACSGPTATTPADASAPASTPLGFANESAAPPSPKATAKPGTKATQPPSGHLAVKFVSLGAVSPGDDASASVQTVAGAKCTLVVTLKSGPSKAQGLGATQADDTGLATWSWHVGLNTTRGSWPATATCTSGSATAKASAKLVVQ